MAFRLADVKKTVRSRMDGDRYVHPKILEGAAVCGQIDLALGYLHARLGRARHEVDPEVLVRCFGDPVVARGLVACLHAAYRWRTQGLADVLEPRAVSYLAEHEIRTPSDLRLYLFDAVNREGDGYLQPERLAHLEPIARRLRLGTGKLDQLIALDAEENAVLVRLGDTPPATQVLRMYNFSVVDVLIRNSRYIALQKPGQAALAALERACATYGVALVRDGEQVRLENRADAFGSYARWGGALARVLYAAASVDGTVLASGRALVRLPGKQAWYEFERKTLLALTGGAKCVHRAGLLPALAGAWEQHRHNAGTTGWRLVGSPNPAVCEAGMVLAPSACRREETVVLLWPVRDQGSLDSLVRLHTAGVALLGLADPAFPYIIPPEIPQVDLADGVAGLLDTVATTWGGARVSAADLALGGLLELIDHQSFIAEAQVAAALGTTSAAELAHQLRSLDPARAVFVPDVGLCSQAFAESMRKGLRRKRGSPAA